MVGFLFTRPKEICIRSKLWGSVPQRNMKVHYEFCVWEIDCATENIRRDENASRTSTDSKLFQFLKRKLRDEKGSSFQEIRLGTTFCSFFDLSISAHPNRTIGKPLTDLISSRPCLGNKEESIITYLESRTKRKVLLTFTNTIHWFDDGTFFSRRVSRSIRFDSVAHRTKKCFCDERDSSLSGMRRVVVWFPNLEQIWLNLVTVVGEIRVQSATTVQVAGKSLRKTSEWRNDTPLFSSILTLRWEGFDLSILRT